LLKHIVQQYLKITTHNGLILNIQASKLTKVTQKLCSAAKIARSCENIKIVLRKITIFWRVYLNSRYGVIKLKCLWICDAYSNNIMRRALCVQVICRSSINTSFTWHDLSSLLEMISTKPGTNVHHVCEQYRKDFQGQGIKGQGHCCTYIW